MIYCVYAVHDDVAELFSQPFFVRNDAEALRLFTLQFGESATDALSLCRSDFSLYLIGQYDDVAGYLESLNTPTLICRGSSLLCSDSEVASDDDL